MIRNMIFDMGHVLIWFDRETFMDRHAAGASEADRQLLVREGYMSSDWIRHDRGTLTTDELVSAICSRLPERLHKAAEGLVKHWDDDILPVAGMAELVGELKGKGYPIYLLSNAGKDHPGYWDKIPGSAYFDDLCVSAFEGYIKPQPEIYQRAIRKFQIRPEESVFIDDVPANIEAAENAGMMGIVFHGDVQELRRKLAALGVDVNVGDDA